MPARVPTFPLVVLHGPSRVGKDHAFKLIAARHVAYRWSVADAIKDATHEAFDLPHAAHHYERCKDDPNIDFHGRTPRQAYIEHGNALRRRHGEHVFVAALAERMLAVAMADESILQVVTDCRLQVEWDVYEQVSPNAVLWRLQSPGIEWLPGDVGGKYIHHFDALLTNDRGDPAIDCGAPFWLWVEDALERTVDVQSLRRAA